MSSRSRWAPWPACGRFLLTLLTSLTLLASPPALAAHPHDKAGTALAQQRAVKAAFLYKFLSYAEFPPHAFSDAGAAFVIGIEGADDMALEVGRIVSGRAINGRPISVRVLHEGEAAPPIHLLFVAGVDSAKVARILRQWSPAPILLVSECGHGLQAGSTINFKVIERHVRFEVSLDAADRSNIKLSSRLLSVANHVSKGVP